MSYSQSKVHSSIAARKMRNLTMTRDKITTAAMDAMRSIGIHIDAEHVSKQVDFFMKAQDNGALVMDSNFVPSITTASVSTPIQFLQTWLPGFVHIITAARKIDDLVGIQTVGSWEDAEIVQGVLEPSGSASEYTDLGNVPLASWNVNFETRSVVRGELGLSVAILEEKRAAAMRVASAEEKRRAVGIALEQMRNAIGFYGFQNGNNRTFGFLNDPNLPAFTTVATGAKATTYWKDKSFLEIVADIRIAFAKLRTQSQDQVDPEKVDTTLAIPTGAVDFLSTVSDFGISVRKWLTDSYPKCRVVSAPELGSTVSGSSLLGAMYLYADSIDGSVDGSTDDGATFAQLVQTKFMTLGVEKRAKSYLEDYSNGTAGVLCKRPFAVVRFIGLTDNSVASGLSGLAAIIASAG